MELVKRFEKIIVMKYGVHAKESVESIMTRKFLEEDANGFFYWGYGGTLCNPLTQVQPFLNQGKRKKAYLLLSRTSSEHHNYSEAAKEFSTNKKDWCRMNSDARVYGSKYALVCKKLVNAEFCVNLGEYSVPCGPSKGMALSEYIRGRVDKGCGIYDGSSCEVAHNYSVDYFAEIIPPYAVFLR